MRILRRIAVVLVVLVVVVVAVALVLPAGYDVQRSVVVDASPARIHALVSDLREWPKWQTWRDEDPSIVVTLGKKTSGIGASQSWSGDSGTGRLFFTAVEPGKGLDYDLTFDDGTWRARASLRYAPQGHLTEVTWRMQGEVDHLIGRYFALAMDGMVGPMFERGLQSLKIKAEAPGVGGLEAEVLQRSTSVESLISGESNR